MRRTLAIHLRNRAGLWVAAALTATFTVSVGFVSVFALPELALAQGARDQVKLNIESHRDVTVSGVDDNGRSGSRVAIADISGDGIADLIIGAPNEGSGSAFASGRTYVVFGPVALGDLSLAAGADLTVDGEALDDHSGIGLGVGDLNGDGAPDLVVGAAQANVGDDKFRAGKTYVKFGPFTAGNVNLSEAEFTAGGNATDDLSGRSIAVGDLNNDGQADLIVGAQGAGEGRNVESGTTYVLFGPLQPGTVALSAAADIVVTGANVRDRSGSGVAAGDVNGDGVDDLIIGAHGADPDGRENAGTTYVMFGPLAAGTMTLPSNANVTINGSGADNFSGVEVAVGDVNADGQGDLLIGANGAEGGGRISSGQSFIVFGPVAAGIVELSSAADVVVNGIRAVDRSGSGIGFGDLNNDGKPDLAIGAPGADPGDVDTAGETYVLFGNILEEAASGGSTNILGILIVVGLGVVVLLVAGLIVWQVRLNRGAAKA